MASVSQTYLSGTSYSDWQDVFPDCTLDCLNNYSYLKIENSTFIPGLRFRFDGAQVVNQGSLLNFRGSVFIMDLSFVGNPNNLLQFYSSGTFSSDVTFTLFDSLSPDFPSGSITLTENGSYDVSSYAEAIVDVPPVVVEGDYHDDLSSISSGLYVIGAILLVIYFFYCIYRMIIKNSGVK